MKKKETKRRPTIDRINEKGNYEMGNLQVLPQRLNRIKGRSSQCFVYLIKGCRIVEVVEFDSQKATIQGLSIPYNTVNSGVLHDIGDGNMALIVSPRGKDRNKEEARYLMVTNVYSEYRDESGRKNREFLRQEQSLVSGIRLSLTK